MLSKQLLQKEIYTMRTYNEYKQILEEWEDCGNQREVMRRTGIPRSTVQRLIKRYQTVTNFEREFELIPENPLLDQLKSTSQESLEIHFHYAYILGLYLGDGEINKGRRTKRLIITLDQKYPQIIARCMTALQTLMPQNKVSYYNCPKGNCVRVSCFNDNWHEIFPQHGAGVKHLRPIILEDWQHYIVDQYPLEFFRGLYHSDGSRSQNIVYGKNYPRYLFSNESDDIRKLFTDTVEKLGLHWTTANRRNLAISKREDVEWLDKYIGAKA
jgi:hypothetical protein